MAEDRSQLMKQLIGQTFPQATVFEPGFAMGYRQSEVKDLRFCLTPVHGGKEHFAARFVFRGKRKQQFEIVAQWVIIKGWGHPQVEWGTREGAPPGHVIITPKYSLASSEWDVLLDTHLRSMSPVVETVFDGRVTNGSVYAPRQASNLASQQFDSREGKLPTSTQIEYPDELDVLTGLREGASIEVLVNKHERNPVARQQCLDHHGYTCKACLVEMRTVYGELARDYIHVHHRVPIAEIGEDYQVDPIKDLVPVCPNCHAMLHRPEKVLSVEELRQTVEAQRVSNATRLPGPTPRPFVATN